MNIKEIIKATLFIAGEGIEVEFLAEKLEIKKAEIKKLIEEIKKEMNTEDSGIQIIEYKNKIQLTSNPKYADQISAVLNPIREKSLTKAALETLAIIAYKQPITRLEIEDIRKVGSDYAINILEEHKLIEVVGRKDAVGKPLLYGTTDEFLKRFDLLDISALPDYDDLLERIAVIRDEEKTKSDSLYYDYKLANSEEEVQEAESQEEVSKTEELIDIVDELADEIKNQTA